MMEGTYPSLRAPLQITSDFIQRNALNWRCNSFLYTFIYQEIMLYINYVDYTYSFHIWALGQSYFYILAYLFLYIGIYIYIYTFIYMCVLMWWLCNVVRIYFCRVFLFRDMFLSMKHLIIWSLLSGVLVEMCILMSNFWKYEIIIIKFYE